MDTSLHEPPPVVDALTSALERDSRTLLDELTRCSDKLKTKPVHAVRTSIRRLLATLELAATLGAPAAPRVVRSLGKLLSALSPLRDSQVQLRTLATMTVEGGEVSALAASLERQEGALRRKASRRVSGFDAERFQVDIAAVKQKLEPGAATRDGSAAQTAVYGELARRHLQVSQQRRRVAADDPRALHQLRLALKSYRYGLAAVAPALPMAVRELSEAVTRLQDQLGAAHDSHVLAKAAAGARKLHARRAAKRLSRALEGASRDAQRDAVGAVTGVELDWPFASSGA